MEKAQQTRPKNKIKELREQEEKIERDQRIAANRRAL
jgi:hypothetical protein